jgi:esterase/lipase
MDYDSVAESTYLEYIKQEKLEKDSFNRGYKIAEEHYKAEIQRLENIIANIKANLRVIVND